MRTDAEPAGTPPDAPETALEALLAGRDVLDGVIIDARGELLAGAPGLRGPAQALLTAAPDADDIEVATASHRVFAARSPGHGIAVVCRHTALPSLVAYELRMAVTSLESASGDQTHAAAA
jgi:hypothetical protein